MPSSPTAISVSRWRTAARVCWPSSCPTCSSASRARRAHGTRQAARGSGSRSRAPTPALTAATSCTRTRRPTAPASSSCSPPGHPRRPPKSAPPRIAATCPARHPPSGACDTIAGMDSWEEGFDAWTPRPQSGAGETTDTGTDLDREELLRLARELAGRRHAEQEQARVELEELKRSLRERAEAVAARERELQ